MEIVLKKPENNSAVTLLSEYQLAFIRNGGNLNEADNSIDWLNLKRREGDNSLAEPCVFEWETEDDFEGECETLLRISENKRLIGYKSYPCEKNRAEVYNLCIGREYFWRVSVVSGEVEVARSEIYSFKTADIAPRFIYAEGVSNVRDIGGWKSNLGKIRQGLFYRGSEMEIHQDITEKGIKVLKDDLKLHTDFDLREEVVGRLYKSRLGGDIYFTHIPTRPYDEFFDHKDTYRKLFDVLLERDNYPMYSHCWGGADRTGTFILVLQALLGVCEKDLFLDYELTSLSIWGDRSRKSDFFLKLLEAVNRYEGNTINEKIESFTLSCGITKEEIEAFRNIMLER